MFRRLVSESVIGWNCWGMYISSNVVTVSANTPAPNIHARWSRYRERTMVR